MPLVSTTKKLSYDVEVQILGKYFVKPEAKLQVPCHLNNRDLNISVYLTEVVV